MSMQYLFHAPAYVVFGQDSRKKTGSLLKKWGARAKVLLVYGQNIEKSGLAMEVTESILKEGMEVAVFSGVKADAPVETVRDGIRFAKESGVSAIVAIGGGSAMDIAKAIAVMLDNPGDILDYAGMDRLACRRSTPLFAIPTTCGTGSEITDGGVIYDEATKYKYAVWDVFCGPDVAILDPFMLDTLSPKLIAATAMDAMAHSIEGYTSKFGNPITDALAVGAIKLIASNICPAYGKKDPEALAQLLTASTMAGISFNRSGVHAGHSIAHALGAVGHMHHGAACALALPYVIKTQAPAIPEKIAEIGRAIGLDIPAEMSAQAVGALVAGEIAQRNSRLGIGRLSDYGITADMLDGVVAYAVKEPLQGRAYVPSDPESLQNYLETIL